MKPGRKEKGSGSRVFYGVVEIAYEGFDRNRVGTRAVGDCMKRCHVAARAVHAVAHKHEDHRRVILHQVLHQSMGRDPIRKVCLVHALMIARVCRQGYDFGHGLAVWCRHRLDTGEEKIVQWTGE